ncbi:MAG: metal-sulfur cluster assembly factor [Candidatus Micrarchaeales archaeon]
MHRITIKEVVDTLKECVDPEVGVNIVDLGLIYGIQIDEKNNIKVKMTMTSPMCPIISIILADVQLRLEKIPDVGNVDIELVWDPLWSPDMMNPDLKARFGYS